MCLSPGCHFKFARFALVQPWFICKESAFDISVFKMISEI